MRFGNDETKPGDMIEETKMKYSLTDVRDEDTDLNSENACKPLRQLVYNCLSDNKNNISMCQEVLTEMRDCERTYARHLTSPN